MWAVMYHVCQLGGYTVLLGRVSKHAQVAVSSPAAALKSVMCRAAADKGAEEEAERQLVAVKKLKAEVARKEGMLKATQSELDKVPP